MQIVWKRDPQGMVARRHLRDHQVTDTGRIVGGSIHCYPKWQSGFGLDMYELVLLGNNIAAEERL
jgi:hypothetical protein